MSDLFHDAASIRDAALAETLRALAPDTMPSSRDGAILAAHLVAVVMAWAAARHAVGTVRDGQLLPALRTALGLTLANAGMNYRPLLGCGHPMPHTQAVMLFASEAVRTAMTLANAAETGTADVSLPIERQADGSFGAATFDVLAMLGAKR